MLLHHQITFLPLSQPHILSFSTRSSPISGFSPVPRSLPALPRVERHRKCGFGAVRCSISPIHGNGTVDYERKTPLKWSALYRRISVMENPSISSSTVLAQWEEDERQLSKWELCRVVKELRKFGRFKRALEVYDWMKSHDDRFTFNSGDYAIQLDLVAKEYDISHAEGYFNDLPDTLKDRRTFGALLNVYGQTKMREKAETTLELMKTKGYGYVLPFNVMMTLYMNVEDHNKVFSMINEMKEKNVPLDLYSYNIWITNCATVGDLMEMERVVQEMIADTRVNTNWTTYTTLATMYIRLGKIEKAQNCLNDVEHRITGRNRSPFNYLLGLYSSIGKRDEVYRIWKRYKLIFDDILNSGYQSMLSSLVKLGDTEGVETIYEEWLSNTLKLDPRICNMVMRFYLREGHVSIAKKILDRFLEKGGIPKPLSWEILAEGYLEKKQVSEVLSCMEGAASYKGPGNWRPKPTDVASVITLCKEQDNKESVQLMIDVLLRTGCLEKEEYKSLIGR